MSAASRHLNFELLSRLVDGRLSVIDDAKARRHLQRCGRCRSELAWLERIRRRGIHEEPDGPSRSRFQLASSWISELTLLG